MKTLSSKIKRMKLNCAHAGGVILADIFWGKEFFCSASFARETRELKILEFGILDESEKFVEIWGPMIAESIENSARENEKAFLYAFYL